MPRPPRPARSRRASRARNGSAPQSAAIYVEGARDREILDGWASCRSRALGAAVRESTVILGGRQPARAHSHLAELRARHGPSTQGICILDRDLDDAAVAACAGHGDLTLFVWGRRHIESYLLVAPAILRSLGQVDRDGRFGRVLKEHLPDRADEQAMRQVDAKTLLGPKGPLARWLGRAPAPGRIARAMQRHELHEDVSGLLDRLEAAFGLGPPEVTFRPRGTLRS